MRRGRRATSKGGVGQNVIAAFGPIVSAVVGAVVTVLLTTPLDRGADTLAGMAMKALPRLVLGVAAGVATFFAIRLLTFLGRKVRPWFRRPATKLKALAPEIERLFDYDGDQLELMLLKNDLSLTRYYRRCDELKAKLSKIGIPAPPRGGVPYWISYWRAFLSTQYQCAIKGDLKEARREAKGLLEYREKEIAKQASDADQKPAADGEGAESGAPPADA